MKFKNTRGPGKGIAIPQAIRQLSGLNATSALEIHVLDGAVVVTKSEMTAMDIVNLIAALNNLSTDMAAHLGLACGECDQCGVCEVFDGTEPVSVPGYVLEQAGLENCKLTAAASGDGIITVTDAGYEYDLTDVPPYMLESFRKIGVCVHELDELLMADEPIYSGSNEEPPLI